MEKLWDSDLWAQDTRTIGSHDHPVLLALRRNDATAVCLFIAHGFDVNAEAGPQTCLTYFLRLTAMWDFYDDEFERAVECVRVLVAAGAELGNALNDTLCRGVKIQTDLTIHALRAWEGSMDEERNLALRLRYALSRLNLRLVAYLIDRAYAVWLNHEEVMMRLPSWRMAYSYDFWMDHSNSACNNRIAIMRFYFRNNKGPDFEFPVDVEVVKSVAGASTLLACRAWDKRSALVALREKLLE